VRIVLNACLVSNKTFFKIISGLTELPWQQWQQELEHFKNLGFFSKMALLKLKNPKSIVTYLFLQLLTSLTKSSLVFDSQ
jgi:hypothetical protein